MIELLERVVETCGEEIMRLRESETDQKAENKDDQLGAHFSTRADIASQELGLSILRDFLPKETVIAEEQENTKEIPEDCTVLDPLDGTTNFFNGLDDFAVTVCIFRSGKPAYGVSYFPVRGQLISAARGRGCSIRLFTRGRKFSCNNWRIPRRHDFIDKVQIGTDVGPWSSKGNVIDAVLKPLSMNFVMQSVLSAVEGGRRVLMGHTVAYYNFGIAKIWDAAAMSLAIEESGGFVSDPYGNPIKWNKIPCSWVWGIDRNLAEIVLKYSQNWKSENGR